MVAAGDGGALTNVSGKETFKALVFDRKGLFFDFSRMGSSLSGSCTVSNLTFGGIQEAIAGSVGLNKSLILAMQSVGGAMGNMVCSNNIVAVCMILGIYNQKGAIIKRTVIPMLIYGVIAALVSMVMVI